VVRKAAHTEVQNEAELRDSGRLQSATNLAAMLLQMAAVVLAHRHELEVPQCFQSFDLQVLEESVVRFPAKQKKDKFL
jgi:hypothetical protein